ncbi:hypothetical protein GH714_041867 [Hevea brasiliensis]|uniref:Cystinosin homolog n=1 Tax=Hevea brasiliensis TaxID=3981 RepID=A0A6A6MW42_HEVBR|nr:hypothetical protein GH714_041867 [Hevea brasiliensis]
MAAWNSFPLKITYEVLGWLAFVSCVVGLNFDFVILNLTKHSSYLVYNASLYFSSAIQKQYFNKYGQKQMIPVAANDVAFSIHAVLLTAITLFQIAMYQRGHQKVSKIAIAIVFIVWVAAAVCFFIALHRHSWLWLISVFNSIQVCMTVIKYIPQAAMNFMRKSTDGFSIGNILLDFLGGLTNYAQMTAQSIDQHSWVNFYGNIGKTMLSLRGGFELRFRDVEFDQTLLLFDLQRFSLLQLCYSEAVFRQMIPVAANDVAFSMHAVLLTAITLLQIAIYDRGNQKVSKIAIAIVCAVWLVAAVCFFIALPSHSWLWLISIFNSIQVFMTVIKYIPRSELRPSTFPLKAVMNFMRKSTDGFSIGNILLDFLGGIANYAQMAVQSIDQNSWVNFYGNIGKTLLSLVCILRPPFHVSTYILYPAEKAHISPKPNEEGAEPLVKSADGPSSENVKAYLGR